jgi:hypothetical protein
MRKFINIITESEAEQVEDNNVRFSLFALKSEEHPLEEILGLFASECAIQKVGHTSKLMKTQYKIECPKGIDKAIMNAVADKGMKVPAQPLHEDEGMAHIPTPEEIAAMADDDLIAVRAELMDRYHSANERSDHAFRKWVEIGRRSSEERKEARGDEFVAPEVNDFYATVDSRKPILAALEAIDARLGG